MYVYIGLDIEPLRPSGVADATGDPSDRGNQYPGEGVVVYVPCEKPLTTP